MIGSDLFRRINTTLGPSHNTAGFSGTPSSPP